MTRVESARQAQAQAEEFSRSLANLECQMQVSLLLSPYLDDVQAGP